MTMVRTTLGQEVKGQFVFGIFVKNSTQYNITRCDEYLNKCGLGEKVQHELRNPGGKLHCAGVQYSGPPSIINYADTEHKLICKCSNANLIKIFCKRSVA